MDTLPLPPRPDAAQYRKRAKSLVTAARSSDPEKVRAWARDWLETLVRLLGQKPSPFVESSINRAVDDIQRVVADRGAEFDLASAQHLIADAHGFPNWSDFIAHVERRPSTDPFEQAADAVVTGDIESLRSLLATHPDLVRAHSKRVHHATLLHYVSANGVEDFRQKTPKNAVEIARLLLDSGAPVDALADTYGKDHFQTTMNLLVSSAHPAGAGLMAPLVEVLVDHGAAVNGLKDDESPILTALYFGYLDAAEALVRRGARVDNVIVGAAMGRLDLVRDVVVDARTMKPGVPLVSPAWAKLPADPKAHIEVALAWACKFRREEIALWLIDLGVNPASKDWYSMTALHWAAGNGMMRVVEELLRRGAPLEVENMWGGVLLDSTLHAAQHAPVDGVDYPAVLRRLLRAGADIRAIEYPTGVPNVDAMLVNEGWIANGS